MTDEFGPDIPDNGLCEVQQPRRVLKDVCSWMTWWGWTSGGGPGSRRLGADGLVLAQHGDDVWKADVERAARGEVTPSEIEDETGKGEEGSARTHAAGHV